MALAGRPAPAVLATAAAHLGGGDLVQYTRAAAKISKISASASGQLGVAEELGVTGRERADELVHLPAGDRLGEDGEDRFGISAGGFLVIPGGLGHLPYELPHTPGSAGEVVGRNLRFAGGVALNRVAADQVRRLDAATGCFAPPASSDRGQALGCALCAWHRLTGDLP